MDVFAFLQEKMGFAIAELQDLIKNYDRLEDTSLMDKSSVIFDNIRSCIKVDANLFYPRIQYDTDFADDLDLSRRLQEEIHYTMEHAIMVHVDEPFDEYLNRMRTLLHLLEKYQLHDRDVLYPYLQRRLSDEDMREVQDHLAAQMQHESIPSKDMKIY